MKITYDITPQAIADELHRKFLLLNPYQSNQALRSRIAVESACFSVTLLLKYNENYLRSDGFWDDVKKCLLNKL